MPSSEEECKIGALQTAMEWLFLRIVATSNDPKRELADFDAHMREACTVVERAATEQLLAGKTDTYSNLKGVGYAMEELRAEMIQSVKIG